MRLFSLVALALLQMGLASNCYAEKVDRPFEKYIRVGQGEVVRASGPVARMDTVLKYSYEYRRTGVLKEDLKGNGLGKIYAPAGARGFVITELGTSAETMTPLWCFKAADLPKYEATCTISGYVFEHVKSRLIASIETTDYTPRIVPLSSTRAQSTRRQCSSKSNSCPGLQRSRPFSSLSTGSCKGPFGLRPTRTGRPL